MNHFYFLLLCLGLIMSSACGVKEFSSNSSPIAHTIWDELVKKHVTETGAVDYKGFQRDSVQLNRYLSQLQNNHPNDKNWSKDEQLAYWINAYNAFTVKLVIDHYPVKSIRDIKSGIPFVNSVWDIKFIQIEGRTYDLNNIEHGIIREEFEEPRIHFALNCASISCPRLRTEAFFADRLEEQLTDQTQYFLRNTIKNQISTNDPKLSKIFSWYRFDFKKGDNSVLKFINQYSDIKIDSNAKISYLDYDWNLNE